MTTGERVNLALLRLRLRHPDALVAVLGVTSILTTLLATAAALGLAVRLLRAVGGF